MIGIIFGIIVISTFWAVGEPLYAWAYIGLWIPLTAVTLYLNRPLPRVKNESNAQNPQR